MKNGHTLASKISNASFLILFPGFFFYHSALGLQIIPPVLGGYFSPVSLVVTPILLILYVVNVLGSRALFTRIDFGFFAYLFYFVFIISVNAIFFDVNSDVVRMHLVAILHLTAVFIIFKFSVFNSKTVWWGLFACWVGMTMIIFFLSSDGFFYLREQEATTNQDYVATYQGFGRSYFLTFLVLVPFIGNMPFRLVVYAFSIAALFVNGSRSEFVGAIVVTALFEIFWSRQRLLALLLAVILGALFVLYADEFSKLLPGNRTLQLLDLSECGSCDERNVTVVYAIEVIKKFPLLGDFGNYLIDIENQRPGSYAHNILSAWVDLGLVGFTWLLLLFAFPLFTIAVEAFSSKESRNLSEVLLPFSLLLVTIFLLFIAKQFTYMLIGAALGSYANYRYRRRCVERYRWKVQAPVFGPMSASRIS